MIHTECFFESHGTKFYRQSWKCDNPRAIIVAIHGLGSHSGGLKHIVENLVPKGYTIHAFDVRGHGKSEGARALVKSRTEYTEDAVRFIEIIKKEEPDLPLFLLGHSLGGVISLDVVMNHPEVVNGLIAIAPALIFDQFRSVLKEIPKEVPDEYSIESEPDTELLTRDTEVIQWMNADSQRHFLKTVGLMRVGLISVEWILNHPEQLRTPLLLIQGGRDAIVSIETNRNFFNSIPFPDKKWIEYPEMLHNPHDEIGREEVLTEISNWLVSHL